MGCGASSVASPSGEQTFNVIPQETRKVRALPKGCAFDDFDFLPLRPVLGDIDVDRDTPLRLDECIRLLTRLRMAFLHGLPTRKIDFNLTPSTASTVEGFLENLSKGTVIRDWFAGRSHEKGERLLDDYSLCHYLGLDPSTTVDGEELPSVLTLVGRVVTRAADIILEAVFTEVASIREEILTRNTPHQERSSNRYLGDLVGAFGSRLSPNYTRWNPICKEFAKLISESKSLPGSSSKPNPPLNARLAKALKDTGVSSLALEVFSVVSVCVDTATLFSYFVLEASHPEYGLLDPLTPFDDDAWTSKRLSELLGDFFRYGCANPEKGMETQDVVLEETAPLELIFTLTGALPPRNTSRSVVVNELSGFEWIDGLPFHCLDSNAIRVVLFLSMLIRGQHKLNLPSIHRESVLVDTALVLRELQPLAPPKSDVARSATSFRIFPTFASTMEADIVPEPGQGHGPRKEFFDVAASTLSSRFAAEVDLRTFATAALTKNMNTAYIRFWTEECTFTMEASGYLDRGNRVTFNYGAESWSSVILEKEQISEVAWELTLDGSSPVTVAKATMHSQGPQMPCFVGETFLWYNTSLTEKDVAVTEGVGTPMYQNYFLAGWLMGQAIGNGAALPLKVPPFFVKLLLCRFFDRLTNNTSRPRFRPTEEHLLLLNPQQRNMNRSVRNMTLTEFNAYVGEVARLDGHTEREANVLMETYRNDPERYIMEQVIERTVVKEAIPHTDAVLDGLISSGLLGIEVMGKVPYEKLAEAIIGRLDDGQTNFSFPAEFTMDYDSSFSDSRRNFFFKRIVADFLEGRWGGYEVELPDSIPSATHFKRTLLQFVTGRRYLPVAPMAEVIRIRLLTFEFFDPTTDDPFEEMFCRLPSSHTCDNTIEFPDYLCGALYRAGGPLCGEDHKDFGDGSWKLLSEDTRKQVKLLVFQQLVLRTALAAYNTSSYELDTLTAAPPVRDPRQPKKPPRRASSSQAMRAKVTEVISNSDFSNDLKKKNVAAGGPGKPPPAPLRTSSSLVSSPPKRSETAIPVRQPAATEKKLEHSSSEESLNLSDDSDAEEALPSNPFVRPITSQGAR